jgi:hypothetical protein
MLNAIRQTLMWVNVNFDYSGCIVILSLKFIYFWMYSWICLFSVHLVGLVLPELKIELADCPIDERTYW